MTNTTDVSLVSRQRQPEQPAGEGRHPQALKATRGQDRPHRDRHHGRLRRIEVELVHHRHEHRRAEREQAGQKSGAGPGRQRAHAVAPERQQRHEDDVRGHDHRHGMNPEQEDRQRPEQVHQRRIGVVVGERSADLPRGQLAVGDHRVDHVDPAVVVRDAVVLGQPPQRYEDEHSRRQAQPERFLMIRGPKASQPLAAAQRGG
jgi:hypothetical protein